MARRGGIDSAACDLENEMASVVVGPIADWKNPIRASFISTFDPSLTPACGTCVTARSPRPRDRAPRSDPE
jgi:hypothetical protein